MAPSITPLGLSVIGSSLFFADDIPAGTFLVLAIAYRQYQFGAPSTGVFSDDAPGLGPGYGNEYAYGNTTPALNGQPWVILASGLTRYDIEGGVTEIVGPLGISAGTLPLYRLWKLEGADTWVRDGLSRSYEADPSTTSDSSTWTGDPGSFPALVGPHALIGMVVAGITGRVSITQTGDFTDTDTASVTTAEPFPIPPENWDSLTGTALVSPGSATNYVFEGDFLPSADCWMAAQAAFRPVYFGMGRERSLARGPDTRLVEAQAATPIGILRDREVSGASSSLPGFGRSVSVLYDRAGRLLHFGVTQADGISNPISGGYGGYTVRLNTSRDQGRTWDAGQVLWSPGGSLSDDPGYQAVEAALSPKAGLLLLMLYDPRQRRWLSSVGRLNSAGTSWSFTDPVERITNAAPSAHLLSLPSGRFRFLYVADGTYLRNLEDNVGFNVRYIRVTDGDQLRFVNLDSVESGGGMSVSAPVIAYSTPAPSGTLPSPVTYHVLDGAEWLEDPKRGLHLAAYHEREITTSTYLVTGGSSDDHWKAVAGTLGADGVTWSFGSPVTLHASESSRDGAFNRRGDGAWRWVEGANMRTAKALDAATGAGTWS